MTDSTRKLAVIVFTDIVGFTDLSSKNEPAALELLDRQRSLLKPIVDSYNGQWLKEIGDGLLLTFEGTLDAVKCCIDIQTEVEKIENLNLRIGIHQGEVVFKNDDVIGDDVNIASRAEPFAESGGIVVTDRVNVSLMRDPSYKTKLIGSPTLKGVRQEISLYCIVSHGLPETNEKRISGTFNDKELPESKPSGDMGSKRTIAYAATTLVIGLVMGLLVFRSFFEKERPSEISEKESIAVMPFVNMSSDKENEYFSDGITEEILNYLAKIKDLRVISRTSVFSYKGRTDVAIADIGRQLNVTHILEGSVRKAGGKVRITAQLIRSKDDANLWSETYDRELEDIFAVQDEIAQTIVGALKMDYIGHADQEDLSISETSMEAYNLYLQGIHFQDRRDEDGMRKGLSFFKRTVEKDPDYALAYVGLANTYLLLADYGYDNFDENLTLAEINASKAMKLNPMSAEVHAANAFVSLIRKDEPSTTEEYYLKAIKINPNYATAHHWYSDFLRLVRKDYQKALTYGLAAKSLDPLSGIISINLANVQIDLSLYDDAERTLKDLIEIRPEFLRAYLTLSFIYRNQGRWEDAESTVDKGISVKPDDGNSWKTLAEIYIAQGKFEKSIAAYDRYVELNKNSVIALEHLASGHYFSKNYRVAKETIEKIHGMTTFSPLADMVQGWIYFHEENYDRGLRSLEKAREKFVGLSGFFESLALASQGMIYAHQGKKDDTEKVLDDLDSFGSANGIESMKGIIALYDGELEKGFDLIEQGVIENNPYVFIKIDPKLQSFKQHERYKEILRLYNLN